jgi:antitoxin HigA-1
MARTAHPGEHLGEELRELGISAAELSRQIGVPLDRVTGIINGQRGVTADTHCASVIGSAQARNSG